MIGTIIFFLFLWVTVVLSLPFGILGLGIHILGFRKFGAKFLQRYSLLWSRLILTVIGCQVRVEGLENIPTQGGICFVGNHPGDLDIILAMAYIDRPFGFTAKKEALFVPFINIWVWLLGGVFIDRKKVSAAKKAIETGAKRIREGGSMIIFPEGTRNRGKDILPFRKGAFKLATLAEAPILPVSIEGTEQIWEAEKRIRRAKVRMVFGPPIPTSGLNADARRELPLLVRDKIIDGLAKPRMEA